MPLPCEKSEAVLQGLALGMVKLHRQTVQRQALLKFLGRHPILQAEEVDAEDFFKQIVDISELLVEREPGEYEFPHLSFQGFFAATQLARAKTLAKTKENAQLVLKNWNEAVWRETVLLYAAQLPPRILDQVIRGACKINSEAAELAALCLKEYPRPEKFASELKMLCEILSQVTQDSKYAKLESLLKAKRWQEADQETYRLMITTVGKEEGQWFGTDDLRNFPCEDLHTLDKLWVSSSGGKYGFSVQKKIWEECGSPTDYNQDWERFGDRVSWRMNENWVRSFEQLDLESSGVLPLYGGQEVEWCGVGVLLIFSRAKTCRL